MLGAQALERHALHDAAGAAAARQEDVGHAARAEPPEDGVGADDAAGADERLEALGEHERRDHAGERREVAADGHQAVRRRGRR